MERQWQVSELDRIIGQRVRDRRIILGLTQKMFAELIGVSRQQVFKYEIGTNSIAPDRLIAIARTLGVHASYFLSGLKDGVAAEDTKYRWLDLQE